MMKILVATLVFSTSAIAEDFPEYDIELVCTRGISEQIADPKEQIPALMFCKSMMGMSRSMSVPLWESATPDRRVFCQEDAAENYARLHSCLGAKAAAKGKRLNSQ